ncbi:MAG TPA: DUF488 domain-containing protein [Pirellulales bacterium]|jgi:uncharacterized protein (DUF488 family)|nr:DUF488 domain-containing protein [Pirellulales bacterium]
MTDSATADGGRAIQLFTIGFAGKSAEQFFQTLIGAGVRKLVDTRLNNVSQLAGFTKRSDLEYFLHVIAGIDYIHDLRLAPTKEMLADFRSKRIDWSEYERRFLELLKARRPDKWLAPMAVDRACLLCSEPTPAHCHRRLVAEYLQARWKNVEIEHL